MTIQKLIATLIVFSSLSPLAHAGEGLSTIACKEIRDEPGTPTSGFELAKEGETFTARYLDYAADESKPATVRVEIRDLTCRFDDSDKLIFDCERAGAGLSGVLVEETKLIGDQTFKQSFHEMRAVGADVPGVTQTYRSLGGCKIN